MEDILENMLAKEKAPHISIIIPVYNVEAYIANCMISIIQQEYKDYEVLLIDNNSDDKSIDVGSKILLEAGVKFKIFHESKQGQASAKNRGIREAKGVWLTFIDPDDTIAPNYLITLLEINKKFNTCVSFAGFKYVSEFDVFDFSNNCGDARMISKYEMAELFLVRKLVLIVPSMMIKRQMFEDYPSIINNEEMRAGEDVYQIWNIIANCGEYVGYTDARLYNYFMRPNSTTTGFDINKTLSCHTNFEKLTSLLNNKISKDIIEYIVYREDIGLIRSAAMNYSYIDYMTVRKAVSSKSMYKCMMRFPDYRVKILSLLCRFFPVLFYTINKRG